MSRFRSGMLCTIRAGAWHGLPLTERLCREVGSPIFTIKCRFFVRNKAEWSHEPFICVGCGYRISRTVEDWLIPLEPPSEPEAERFEDKEPTIC
jgi:hypothetical protein